MKVIPRYNFSTIILILLLLSFFLSDDVKTLIYFSALILSIIRLFKIRNFSRSAALFYLKLISIISISVLGGYFDFKNYLNQIGFFIIGLNLINIIRPEHLGEIIKIFKSFYRILFVLIIFGYFLALKYILSLDINTYYLKIYQTIGLFKQDFGQLLIFPILYLLQKGLSNRVYTYIGIILTLPLLIGARSVLFGFISLLIIHFLYKKKIKPIYTFFGIYFFHIALAYYISKNDNLHFFYELDPRWGMQLISISVAGGYLFGVGFAGWNEYVFSMNEKLLGYLDYFPSWLGYKSAKFVPTTLESSLFQLNVEIGFISTFFLYYILFKETIKKSSSPTRYIMSSGYIIILFSSFYEDNLFQPIWHIATALILTLNYLNEKTSKEYS